VVIARAGIANAFILAAYGCISEIPPFRNNYSAYTATFLTIFDAMTDSGIPSSRVVGALGLMSSTSRSTLHHTAITFPLRKG